jgi:hypothetical protein
MFALIGTFKMDTAQYDTQRRELEERIVPMVKHQPGFVSGTWSYDKKAGRSYSNIVFDTETSARKLAEFLQGQAQVQNAAGVHLESITVAEVLAAERK